MYGPEGILVIPLALVSVGMAWGGLEKGYQEPLKAGHDLNLGPRMVEGEHCRWGGAASFKAWQAYA
jgi:hypothetical protein